MARGVTGSGAGRIAVAVSGTGSNMRALVAAARRGELGGEVVFVVADRPCPALDWAVEAGIDTALVPGGEDGALAAALTDANPDVVVVAGYMRLVGPTVLAAFAGRILNTHPSLLPSFPGAHAVRDAIAHGTRVSGATVHLVDESLDGGPILAQEAVTVEAGDDEATLHARILAVEHRILPRAVALLLAGVVGTDGRRTTIDVAAAERAMPVPRRALLS
ncbi:MAG TPA: phosphoribosylglycinamide formyltransferase, partial [Candidatus Acidoferrum sp.]|nr:phosphoribosylglycinamide formyltransferase [Candidatus Acidoferrum sp.]